MFEVLKLVIVVVTVFCLGYLFGRFKREKPSIQLSISSEEIDLFEVKLHSELNRMGITLYSDIEGDEDSVF